MLATLRSQVEALGGLRTGSVDEQELDRRFAETDAAVTALGQRLDTLGGTVESAASSLSDKEHELAALHRHFTESSMRIESIVDDIREALHAFPELGSNSLGELVARVERIETAAREAAETTDRRGTELMRKVDRVDARVASVAAEVVRAKTLWPVALRSLEARLEDVAHSRHAHDADDQDPALADGDPPDDLLAGLRDSLQAMESVAAEMARASDTLSEPLDHADIADEPGPHEEDVAEPAAAAAGATIVPLRASEP
jgi:chromosome segregation ATPase